MLDPVARATMLDIAAKYDVMAQRAAKRETRTTNNPGRGH
jgi:hypothetical protein